MWNLLSGAGLGGVDATPKSALGRTNAEATVWISDSMVFSLATVPIGGRSRAALITVAVQAGTLSGSTSYDTPVIIRVPTFLLLSPIACNLTSNDSCLHSAESSWPAGACQCCALQVNQSAVLIVGLF